MEKYFNETLWKLETAINELEIEADSSIQRIETIIHVIVECLSGVKEHILKNEFQNVEEEVHFFKHQKPVIVSKLIYYNAIYKIEAKKPYGAKPIRKYLNKELKKLKRFFDNNIDFYKYYRSNNSFLDDRFFVRGKHDVKLWLDTIYFETDQSFSTSHDYKVAKIIANELIQVYIENQLNTKNYNKTSHESPLKLISKTFEKTFNIDLGDFYHTFMELKSRKINRTKFLDSLRDALIKKMDEQDEI
jgi:hypothetical protein